jgi:hypothetical protein
MNLYFISLLNKDKVERRKMRCSIFQFEIDPDFSPDIDKLKEKFRPNDGDIFQVPGSYTNFWIEDNVSEEDQFQVTDTKFHPLYWEHANELVFFSCSKEILLRLTKSKLKEEDDHLIFSKIRIGKMRYKIIVKRYPAYCPQAIISDLEESRPDEVRFYYMNSNLYCHL